MTSQFVHNFTRNLTASSPSLPFATLDVAQDPRQSTLKHDLHALLASFPQSQLLDSQQAKNAISVLLEYERKGKDSLTAADAEEEALKEVLIGRIVVSLYAEAMDIYLTQAAEAEAEAEWWRDIERSKWKLAWYLLQTTPVRLYNATRAVASAVRAQGSPMTLTSFTPFSLAKLFPTSPTSPFRPTALTTACFPHLSRSSYPMTGFFYLPPPTISEDAPFGNKITYQASHYSTLIANGVTYPLSLTRQECRSNRRDLEGIRNERAEILGQLSRMRNFLVSILSDPSYEYSGTTHFLPKIQRFVEILDQKAAVDVDTAYPSTTQALAHLSHETIPQLRVSHKQMLGNNALLRPRTLVLIWPKIVLIPLLSLYVCKSLYASRVSLEEVAKDAVETVKGFVRGWLLEPLRDVLKTVRSSYADDGVGVLVRKEGVLADLDSLERMTLSLARDKLHYNESQLASLSRQIRLGDMTPVMEVYEEDIRRPLRSAIGGTLLRNVFIQVQKTKVDIDQALTGIDHLLKSQELTFAFVGVAPALAIVYLAGGVIVGIWTGNRGRGRYGGINKRRSVWDAMRRVERLLVAQPSDNQQVAALPSGLLLLSLANLRAYATSNLPTNSRLREGFLEDLDDLESPELGRDAKLEVVHRMWRCWGTKLGWKNCGEYR
ncbi:hypothetical protein AGABI1DRAFT_120679 [Agaricus bisporus var. burnettii JB137-S8]|uniref:NCA2-domain-containing protein n=1 Tax=Agaricus bisporus var. burnettii (strain JB137-S8 / ATCC MYA-4627 / FGSC 10392) TaxID=597362 RepID=K5VXN9_AGABU|nr:uncharacterized protein AGABI1DRAFT_120679 [Agaricus bisporus var. burnettii JB137-S8]EKM79254.1 hypothetical protein AGABI1DRAFT_120679 [Agaricus bisporus var. burnettii JB137-S8]